VPITRPRLVLALAAVEAPVPPSATVKSVIPVIVPAEIFAVVIVAVVIFAVVIVAVGITTVPVKVGLAKSALVAIEVAMLLNSVSISVPFTIFRALPEDKASLVAKFVDFV